MTDEDPDKPASAGGTALGIRAKLIGIFVLIKVIPLLILAIFLFYLMGNLGGLVARQVALLSEQMGEAITAVGTSATNDASKALDERAREEIERLTTDTARSLARFLYERDADIRFAASLAASPESFRSFLSSRQGAVVYHQPWKLSADGSSWEPETTAESSDDKAVVANIEENKKEFHYRPPETKGIVRWQPLYLEMTLVDLNGQELVKVTTSQRMHGELRDVSNPENTYIKAERYFSELKKLKPGQIYVSDVIGAYQPSPVIGPYTREAARRLGIRFEPEKAGYAGKENPVGRRFQGLIRWATPVVEAGEIVAYVTLALDHTHIMEFTDHLVPTTQRYSAISDALSGNYAFMWDYLGRNISHPRDYFIVGYDPDTGEPVMPWLEETHYAEWQRSGLGVRDFLATLPWFEGQGHDKKPSKDMVKQGHLALDCRFLNFAPQCAGWMNLTRYGGSGSFVIFWGGLWKLTTAAVIPYFTGQYANSPRGFGFVTIGANVDQFHQPAVESRKRLAHIVDKQLERAKEHERDLLSSIKRALTKAYMEISLSTLLMTLAVILIAVWMASYLTRRITALINGIRHFEQGNLSYRLPLESRDEMGQLTESINAMAEKLGVAFNEIQTTADDLSMQNVANQRLMEEMQEEITERQRAERKLNRLAYYDSLTQLPNRAQLNEWLGSQLKQAEKRGEVLAVLFIDLDGFKYVNDTLGHSIGDRLLLKVANRLRHQSRMGDFIARLGGDEFTVVLQNVPDIEAAGQVAQKIIDQLSTKFVVAGHDVYINASIGVCVFPDNGTDVDTIMKNADTAMYHAKDQGKGCYRFCTDELNRRAEERLVIASDLRKALERKEFVLYYQPKVDTYTAEMIGLEALIRWQHPEKGMIAPDRFIPIAEETGVILQIGEWVLRRVCQQQKQWLEQGLQPVPVALNVSARQFSQSDLAGLVANALAETGIEPNLIELELTETLVMRNPGRTIRILEELGRLGVGASIDDFGTGYSSLSYLRRFPVSTLKIDRSFVRDLDTDPGDVELALAMVSMAHSMGLKVVAEGVEDEAQRSILKEMACDYLQGYLFSRPLPAQEVTGWLRR